MKKTAVMIYRAFCMQEISCLTDWLVGLGKPMIVCAADHQPVKTEEGFTVLPEFSYDEVDLLSLIHISLRMWKPWTT